MFHNCHNLKYLEIDDFYSKKVEDMSYMFSDCTNLSLLDLSKFETSSCHNFEGMFNNCSSLEYLNLSNFRTEFAENMNNMFAGCEKLLYLNISNFDTSSVTDMSNMFKDCKSLIYLNIGYLGNNHERLQNNIFEGVFKEINICIENIESNRELLKYDLSFDCSNNCFINKINIDTKNKKCVENCKDNGLFQYNHICMNDCPKGSNPVYRNEFLCEKNVKCKEFRTNINKCLNNFKRGYFLDLNDGIYKPCYRTCYSCNASGDINNNNCIEYSMDVYLNYLHSSFNFFDTTEIDNGFDFIHYEEPALFTLTTTYNQKHNQYSNVTHIDLGECEDKIKQENHLSENSILYILKIEIFIPGEKKPKVKYEIYYPFEEKKLTLLNISVCEDKLFDIYIPFNLSSEILYKYNQINDFNNEICKIYTNEEGTALNALIKDLADNNITICEEGCVLDDYDIEQKLAKCSCSIRINEFKESENKRYKDRLIDNIISIKDTIDVNLFKCIHLIFDSKLIYKNIVNYMFVFLLIFSIVSIFVFSLKHYKKIKNLITNVYGKRKEKFIKKMNDFDQNNDNPRRRVTQKRSSIIGRFNIPQNNKEIKNLIEVATQNDNQTNNINSFQIKNKLEKSNPNKINKLSLKKALNNKKRKKSQKLKCQTIIDNSEIKNAKDQSNMVSKTTVVIGNIEIDQSKLIDSEINLLEYKKALKLDHRNYLEYYISLLRTKHILLFSFNNKDYNSTIIKIYIFFFTFYINFSISALFYTKLEINKIYQDEGTFDFVYQIPKMLYSSLISMILISLIKMLGLFEENMLKIKKCKFENINTIIEREIKNIKIKIILFYTITYILLVIFWLYVGSFCAIYQSAQLHLLKKVSSSFGISLFTSLLICLLPGLFRIPALKSKNKKLLYKVNLFLQLLC